MQNPIAGSTVYCNTMPSANNPGCLVNTCGRKR